MVPRIVIKHYLFNLTEFVFFRSVKWSNSSISPINGTIIYYDSGQRGPGSTGNGVLPISKASIRKPCNQMSFSVIPLTVVLFDPEMISQQVLPLRYRVDLGITLKLYSSFSKPQDSSLNSRWFSVLFRIHIEEIGL